MCIYVFQTNKTAAFGTKFAHSLMPAAASCMHSMYYVALGMYHCTFLCHFIYVYAWKNALLCC